VSCEEFDTLIHGYLDGELDLLSTLRVEAHLPECVSCARTHERHRALRSAMNSGKLYFKPPNDLAERIHLTLHQANKAEGRASPSVWKVRKTMPRRTWWPWMSIAATSVVVGAIAWRLGSVASGPSPEDLLAQEVLASHVRSLMADHLTDVPSSDQHTVKPWFNGKLDFSPPVKDLSGEGFPLVGGRLDYLKDRPVAVLVYQRRKHFINLFIWPSAEDSRQKTVTRQGYNLFHWTQSGMTYWTMSDLNQTELQEFVRFVQGHDGRVP
jgi:anti-sigma factor RsiW